MRRLATAVTVVTITFGLAGSAAVQPEETTGLRAGIALEGQGNFVAPFVYFLCQRTNLTDVRDWLNANRTRRNS